MMPSYDDDRPTFEEENLCQRLKTNLEEYQQIQALIQVIFFEENFFVCNLENCSS